MNVCCATASWSVESLRMKSATEYRLITVLVVEDEFLIRVDIADRLREAGFLVLEAGSADAAIRILETRSDIHLVFTDVDMPGSMDGLRLAAHVRDRWPPIKLIVTSGHVALKEGELPTGGRFLPKPYEVGPLSSAIVELITAEADSFR
jgi:CheY-like chemotaxis protein